MVSPRLAPDDAAHAVASVASRSRVACSLVTPSGSGTSRASVESTSPTAYWACGAVTNTRCPTRYSLTASPVRSTVPASE